MKVTEAAYLAGIIDGEGTITLSRLHACENRRPVITIASTDIELLQYIQKITGGSIHSKKNYNPNKHKNSYTLSIKNKKELINTLNYTLSFLKVPSKIHRAQLILNKYDRVTPRNGKYSLDLVKQKKQFEESFLDCDVNHNFSSK